jgi:hypothetical protein
VAFLSERDGGGVFVQSSDGAQAPERLLDVRARPYHETPDGSVLYHTTPGPEIGIVSASGGSGELLIATRAIERQPALSPNGQWIAYVSDESGRDEIYVRAYPDVGTLRRLVSTEGGYEPRWSPDGKTLYYLSLTGWLTAVAVESEPFAAGTPAQLFPLARYKVDFRGPPSYDVAPDGRFLFARLVGGVSEESASRSQLVLVENLFAELERLVPTN